MNLIAFVGFAGSGKGTAAQALVDEGWVPVAFADALKDALAVIFRWPRHLLEGDTAESRAWREQVDSWWANRLGIPDFSPRRAMQLVGTEVMRDHLHSELWVASVERRLADMRGNVVITDARFPDEIAMIKRHGGRIIRVRRGPDPAWWPLAIAANRGCETARGLLAWRTDLHVSEWAWIGSDLDATIENDGTVAELHAKVTALTLTHESNEAQIALCPMPRGRGAPNWTSEQAVR